MAAPGRGRWPCPGTRRRPGGGPYSGPVVLRRSPRESGQTGSAARIDGVHVVAERASARVVRAAREELHHRSGGPVARVTSCCPSAVASLAARHRRARSRHSATGGDRSSTCISPPTRQVRGASRTRENVRPRVVPAIHPRSDDPRRRRPSCAHRGRSVHSRAIALARSPTGGDAGSHADRRECRSWNGCRPDRAGVRRSPVGWAGPAHGCCWPGCGAAPWSGPGAASPGGRRRCGRAGCRGPPAAARPGCRCCSGWAGSGSPPGRSTCSTAGCRTP